MSDEKAQDPNAYFGVEELIEYVRAVEEEHRHPNTDEPDDPEEDRRNDWDRHDNGSSVHRTASRIRAHSYGSEYPFGYFEGEIFALSLPKSEHIISIDWKNEYRILNSDTDRRPEYRQAYSHLTARADENGFQDNPSPYILLSKIGDRTVDQKIDLGQVLYGFESLAKRFDNSKRPRLATAYKSYGINIAYDLAGVIANIATPAAEALFHDLIVDSIHEAFNPPKAADLGAYYRRSAPDADLLGNADAVGLANAHENLKHEVDLKLSELLSLYYTPEDRQVKITQPHFTVRDRWLALAEYLGLVRPKGDHFVWLPGQPSWESDQIRINLRRRMFSFGWFWWNCLSFNNKLRTGYYLLRDLPNPYVQVPGGRFAARLGEKIDLVLQDYFLPFLKRNIIEEDNSAFD